MPTPPTSSKTAMASEAAIVEGKLLGLTVAMANVGVGIIKELPQNRPWYFAVEINGRIKPSVHLSQIVVGAQTLSDYLARKGIVLDRAGWTSLVSINHPEPTAPDPTPQPSDHDTKLPPKAEYLAGWVKWFGGKNSHTGRINEFGFITSRGFEVYFHQSAVVAGIESIRQDTPVAFTLETGSQRNRPAAHSVHVLARLQDIGTLTALFTQGTSDARLLILTQSSLQLPIDQFIVFANQIREFLDEPDLSRIVYEKLGLALLVTAEARSILGKIAADEQLDLFARVDDLSGLSQEVIGLLQSDRFQLASATARAKFWAKHTPEDQSSALYPYLDIESKRSIWRTTALPKLPMRVRIQALLREKGRQSRVDWYALVFLVIQRAAGNDERRTLLGAMPTALQLEFIERLDDLGQYGEIACAALARAEADVVLPEVLDKFWRKHWPTNPKDQIFKFAPLEIKKFVCRAYYTTFIQQITSFFDRVVVRPAFIPAPTIYETLTDADRDLARLWQHQPTPYVEAQMLSARGAELAAIQFYTGVGYSVTDVASLQLKGTNGDWLTHDLLLNNEIPIDVKNSRVPSSNANFYVEHTVAKFKRDRRSKPVRVAGVLSPYLQLKYINAPRSAEFDIEPIRYLGETSWPAIESLMKNFSSESFEVRHGADHVVPHWLFDYPDAWYQDYYSRARQLKDLERPSDAEWSLLFEPNEEIDVLPQLCALGLPLPAYFRAALPAWQTALYRKMQSACPDRPHLPSIFLVLLTDFLEQLEKSPEGYSPGWYKHFLFGSKHDEKVGGDQPLGLTDPMRLIDCLCSALETLWGYRDALDLRRFKSFRFSGLGVLQGRKGVFSEWETVLAYCGGRVYECDHEGNVIVDRHGTPIKDSGKCGRWPLIIGRNKTCEVCHKLVCTRCGYCCQSCERRRFATLASGLSRVVGSERGDCSEVESHDNEPPSHVLELIPLVSYGDLFDRH